MTFKMIHALEGKEWALANSMITEEDQEKTGYLGCMTMYYDKRDKTFLENWCPGFDRAHPLKFFEELHIVISYLQNSARYRILWEAGMPAWSLEDYQRGFKGRCHLDFSARVDTAQHTYLFRCDEGQIHRRDVHIFCYHTEMMEIFLKQWKKKYMMREKFPGMSISWA